MITLPEEANLMRFFVPIGWPQINEDYLLELATDWDEAAREAGRVGGELSDSVRYVLSRNDTPATDNFRDYMAGESNPTSLAAYVTFCEGVARGLRKANETVAEFKQLVVDELTGVAEHYERATALLAWPWDRASFLPRCRLVHAKLLSAEARTVSALVL